MSALEETSDAAGDIKLMKFRFALQQDEFARAEALVAELKDAGLSEVKVAMAEAELLAAQDKTDEAITKLREAAEKFSDAVELVTYAAVLSNRQGDREKCEEIIRRALERVAGPVVRRKLGLLLAQFYVSWDQKDKAYTCLTRLHRSCPTIFRLSAGYCCANKLSKIRKMPSGLLTASSPSKARTAGSGDMNRQESGSSLTISRVVTPG
jgi:tetratricopeptide (TPR) repeat protein